MCDLIAKTYRDGYESISDADLDDLEKRARLRLPREYREFLLQQNGGWITDTLIFRLPTPTSYTSAAYIDRFFMLSKHAPNNIEAESEEVPLGFVAIASCNESRLCIDARPESRTFGAVYFWDVDEFYDERARFTYWAAESLTSLLQQSTINYDLLTSEDEHLICKANIDDDITELLRHHGRDINARLSRNRTLLIQACQFGRPRVVKLLLRAGADPSVRSSDGRTALHFAAAMSSDCVKLLLDAGISINSQDNRGKSALMVAAEASSFYNVELLLTAKADKFLSDDDEKTAIDYCKDYRIEELLK